MQVTSMLGPYPDGVGGFTSQLDGVIMLYAPHWSLYVRLISRPLQSLIEIGTNGTEAFSPKSGAIALNSAVASSVMSPVLVEATGAAVKMKKVALVCIWSLRATSLRSHSGRSIPANGATCWAPGYRLRKSGTRCMLPAQGGKSVSVVLSLTPRLVVGLLWKPGSPVFGFPGLALPSVAWSGRM